MNRKHKTIRKRISATRYSLKTNRGFVLSLAVLISGILLSIGLAIFSNALKELILSSSGRESQFAFYAADTGGECALYWDIRHPALSESAFASSTDNILPQGSGVSCNNEDITDPATGWDGVFGWGAPTQNGSAVTTVFDMKFANGSCATVAVIKDSGTTKIDSRGFNTCDAGNPRRVERGLRVSY
ncbi:MAG: hypothetical protein AAB523_02540 [Patescibacteria group bacterium]